MDREPQAPMLADLPQSLPTKPTKPGFVGFVGSIFGECRNSELRAGGTNQMKAELNGRVFTIRRELEYFSEAELLTQNG